MFNDFFLIIFSLFFFPLFCNFHHPHVKVTYPLHFSCRLTLRIITDYLELNEAIIHHYGIYQQLFDDAS